MPPLLPSLTFILKKTQPMCQSACLQRLTQAEIYYLKQTGKPPPKNNALWEVIKIEWWSPLQDVLDY